MQPASPLRPKRLRHATVSAARGSAHSRKCCKEKAAARSAPLAALDLRRQQLLRVACEGADRTQRNMAGDPPHTELGIVDQRAGQRLIALDVGADETRQIVEVAAHLPALDYLVDGAQALLQAIRPG